jgi:hypothetical protein
MRAAAIVLSALAVLVCQGPAYGQADQEQDLREVIEALKARLEAQERRIAELEARGGQPDGDASRRAQREAVEAVLADLEAERGELGFRLPAWAKGIDFGGDFRLRYQGEFFDWGPTADTEKRDRHRGRFRLRVGATKSWLDEQVEVGFRLASGQSDDPTSTNQTFTDNFSEKPVWIDLAYARFSPKPLEGLSVVAGKMKNPWLTNEIFIDSDMNPEGVWAGYKGLELGPVRPFAGGGYFVLREVSSDFDTILCGGQAGADIELAENVEITTAAYWRNFDHYADSGASPRGNNRPLDLVPAFGLIGLSNALNFEAFGQPVGLLFEWAHNCHEKDRTSLYSGDNDAYYAGVRLGRSKAQGDWQVRYAYAVVQANSVPGYFVDSDFGHGNRRGHVLRGQYKLLDSLTAGVNLFLTEPVFSPTTDSGSSPFEDRTFTLQADLIWKF